MKKISILTLLFAAIFCLSSCLRYNLEELPAFSDADITGVNLVEYRYFSDNIVPVSGEKMVKYVTLNYSNIKIDASAATCTFDVSTPSNFPADRLSDLSLNKLVVVIQVSTAARCEPIDGSTPFGVPGDWSKPNKYKITAADGSSKVWTVSVSNFTK